MALPPFKAPDEKSTDTWLTPLPMIRALGWFDLDPCSAPGHRTARFRYLLQRGEDGLKLRWFGRVWLNPPYSTWPVWAAKMKEHGNGILLIFARTETRGFFDHCWDGADSVLFVKRRIRFLLPDGSKGGTGTVPSVMLAYGENNVQAIDRMLASGVLEGKHIRLTAPGATELAQIKNEWFDEMWLT